MCFFEGDNQLNHTHRMLRAGYNSWFEKCSYRSSCLIYRIVCTVCWKNWNMNLYFNLCSCSCNYLLARLELVEHSGLLGSSCRGHLKWLLKKNNLLAVFFVVIFYLFLFYWSIIHFNNVSWTFLVYSLGRASEGGIRVQQAGSDPKDLREES